MSAFQLIVYREQDTKYEIIELFINTINRYVLHMQCKLLKTQKWFSHWFCLC